MIKVRNLILMEKESDLWKLKVLWIRGKRDSLVGNVN